MESQATVPSGRPCSQTEEDRDPLPTDSMVTVPLSDRQTDSTVSDNDTTLPAEEFASPIESPTSVEADDNEVPKTEERSESRRTSDSKPSVKSRPSSQCTENSEKRASSDSNGVDWAGLERTERIESKADGTDAVSLLIFYTVFECGYTYTHIYRLDQI